MKHTNFLTLILLFFYLASCTNQKEFEPFKESKITHLSYRLEKYDADNKKFGFVDCQGNIIKLDFLRMASNAYDSIFDVTIDTITENYSKSIALCKISGNSTKILMTGLYQTGNYNFGLVPVVRLGEPLMLVDSSGKVKFSLDKINGKHVWKYNNTYGKNALLLVQDIDRQYHFIDTTGKIAISVKDNEKIILNNNRYFDRTDNFKNVIYTIDGDTLKCPDLEIFRIVVGGNKFAVQIGVNDNNYYIIYNYDGSEVLKCSPDIMLDKLYKDGFSYRLKNSNYKYGLMNYTGQKITENIYESVSQESDLFICKTSPWGSGCDLLDKTGKKIKNIKNAEVDYVYGYGYVLNRDYRDSKKYSILDSALNEGFTVQYINTLHSYDLMNNTKYFDYDYIAEYMYNKLQMIENQYKFSAKPSSFGDEYDNCVVYRATPVDDNYIGGVYARYDDNKNLQYYQMSNQEYFCPDSDKLFEAIKSMLVKKGYQTTKSDKNFVIFKGENYQAVARISSFSQRAVLEIHPLNSTIERESVRVEFETRDNSGYEDNLIYKDGDVIDQGSQNDYEEDYYDEDYQYEE